jgi:hypothetical protein
MNGLADRCINQEWVVPRVCGDERKKAAMPPRLVVVSLCMRGLKFMGKPRSGIKLIPDFF